MSARCARSSPGRRSTTAPPADDFDFSGIDPIVLDAARNGIEVLPFLFGTPTWVARDLDGHESCDPDCATYAPTLARGDRGLE